MSHHCSWSPMYFFCTLFSQTPPPPPHIPRISPFPYLPVPNCKFLIQPFPLVTQPISLSSLSLWSSLCHSGHFSVSLCHSSHLSVSLSLAISPALCHSSYLSVSLSFSCPVSLPYSLTLSPHYPVDLSFYHHVGPFPHTTCSLASHTSSCPQPPSPSIPLSTVYHQSHCL